MVQPINIEGLKKYQHDKRAETVAKVKEAIETLQDEGKEVNFKSVSQTSFITRKTLYKVSEIREMIEALRKTPKNHSEFYIDTLKKRVKELEKENMVLKDKVKQLSGIKYGVVKLKEFINSNLSNRSA